MSPVQEMMKRYHELASADRLSFYLTLVNNADIDKENMEAFRNEARMKDGGCCLHCGSTHFVKNGRRADGTQRYLCRDCNKSFLASTNSIVSRTRKQLSVWKQYFDCMMAEKTLQESARECGISMSTAFFWRHKILDCLQDVAGRVCLGGTVEADETFFNVSYKGNHTRSREFSMPRKSHKRGGDVHTKGLSSEKVCVMCAVNENGVPIAQVGKLGKVSSQCVTKAFTGRISPEATLVTDHERAYVDFSDKEGLVLIQMETDRRTNGTYDIQRINSYHSRIKEFTRHFHGVSTKYLDNYLTWYNVMFCFPKEKEDRGKLLLSHALASLRAIPGRELARRPAVPSLV